MNQDLDTLTGRFDKSLYVLMQNLGPHLITRAHLGLTPGQVFMLHFIQQENQCRVSTLAERMEVAPSAITVMLDRLEHHGLVIRKRHESDRRVVIIELTEQGLEKLSAIRSTRNKIIQHCLAELEPPKLDSFVQTLEELSSICQSMDIKKIIE